MNDEKGISEYLKGKTAKDFDSRFVMLVWFEYFDFATEKGYVHTYKSKFVKAVKSLGLEIKGSRRFQKTYFKIEAKEC